MIEQAGPSPIAIRLALIDLALAAFVPDIRFRGHSISQRCDGASCRAARPLYVLQLDWARTEPSLIISCWHCPLLRGALVCSTLLTDAILNRQLAVIKLPNKLQKGPLIVAANDGDILNTSNCDPFGTDQTDTSGTH